MSVRRLSLALLSLALVAPGCRHTYQKQVEPTKEQKLELYSTTATYLYEDGELERAEEQAVKALTVAPKDRAMRRMIGWIRLRKNGNQDLILAERFFRDLIHDGDANENTKLGLALACERLGKAYDDVSRSLLAGEREPDAGQQRESSARDLAAKAQRYWQESIRICDQILAAGEGNTNAMNALQRVLALTGDYEASLSWSARLLERTGAELASWRQMLQEKDLTEREEALFRKNERGALALETDTHVFAATLLFRLQRYEEALAHLFNRFYYLG